MIDKKEDIGKTTLLKKYQPPKLIVYGDVNTITLSASTHDTDDGLCGETGGCGNASPGSI